MPDYNRYNLILAYREFRQPFWVIQNVISIIDKQIYKQWCLLCNHVAYVWSDTVTCFNIWLYNDDIGRAQFIHKTSTWSVNS